MSAPGGPAPTRGTGLVVAASFVVMGGTWGAYSCFGVVLKDLAHDIGSDRAGVATAYSTSALVAGILSLAAGAWTDRYGPRRVVVVSGLIFALGLGTTAVVQSLWQLFVTLGLLTGAGLSGMFVPVVTMTTRLPGRQAVFTGVVVSGAGFGGIVGPQIANVLMESYGWRAVFAVLAGFAALAIVVFGRLLPGLAVSSLQAGEGAGDAVIRDGPSRATGAPGRSPTRALVVLSVVYGIQGLIMIGNSAHFQAHMTDLGFTSGQAAAIVGLQAAAGVVGSFGVGFLSDRLGPWPGFVGSYLVMLLGLCVVIFAGNLVLLGVAAALIGLGAYGIGAAIPGLTAELCGLARLATILGRLELFWSIGAWLGPSYFGITFDVTGTYRAAYATAAVLAAGAVLAGPLLRSSRDLVPPPHDIPAVQYGGTLMHVVGYADRFSVEPGQAITFMISSPAPRYRAEMVRLIHGDPNARGPGFKSEPVASDVEGEHDGHVQELFNGSYLRIPHSEQLDLSGSFTMQLWIQPSMPDKAHQVLLAKSSGSGGYSLELDHGRLTLVRPADPGGGPSGGLAVDRAVAPYTWYFVAATYDAARGEATLRLEPLAATAGELAASAQGGLSGAAPAASGEPSDLLVAARPDPSVPGGVGDYYNGKIDGPRLYDRALTGPELDQLRQGADPTSIGGLVAAWDFSIGISSSAIRDISGHGHEGGAVQRPGRAVTGHNWDGSESSWTHRPEQYGAIHFHDDDLDDAGWNPSVTWHVAAGTPSGVYALHVVAGDEEDYIPFAVRPRLGAPTAPILFQMPTFSYLAYANEHLLAAPGGREMLQEMGVDPDASGYPAQWQDKYIIENHLNSLYDVHTDGSGVFYSSRRRPVLNMRPKYDMPGLDEGHGSPHQFNADMHTVDWLHEQGFQFDVATDEDVYREGRQLLDQYRVVITGTHHEYWASSMIDAMRDYLTDGGRLMYLAGNGFYWVTELEPEKGHTIEIRRRGPSTRSWDAAGGETHLSSTGELGGLWRYRNRAPQQLVGVGFTAQGIGAGRPYQRQPDSFDPRAAFVFEGVGADELIGDHPCLVSSYGAAGFEIDRVDYSLGSPHRTMLLATASGFSDYYQHVSEETLMTTSREGGTVNPLVRADMVLLEYPAGGAVFTPASISWSGSLSYNGYQNNVSRITGNVLRRFLEERPVFSGADDSEAGG